MTKCPICESNSAATPRATHGDYRVVYCSDCQLQYSDPMTEPDASFYQTCDLYEYRSHSVHLEIPSNDWRFFTCLNQIDRGEGDRLLDIGCGDGGFLALAAANGYNVSGLDVDPRAVDLARNKRHIEDVRHGDWTELDKMNGWENFDKITMFDVLEHLGSPVAVLSQVSKLLNPGGEVILTVPRLDRFPRLFDKQADIPPHHLTLWTAKALKTLCDNSGLDFVRVIKKPLRGEDLLGHLVWRIKGVLRRNERPEVSKIDTTGTDSDSTQGASKVLMRLLKAFVRVGLEGVVLVLRVSGGAKGHTLILMAKKSSKDSCCDSGAMSVEQEHETF